jgi:dephospho-CoA kinase
LIEAQMTDLVTEIWVVICSQAQQLQRLIERNHLTQQQAQARISSQLSLTEKAAIADVVLDNSSSLEALLKQVDERLLTVDC